MRDYITSLPRIHFYVIKRLKQSPKLTYSILNLGGFQIPFVSNFPWSSPNELLGGRGWCVELP